MHRVQQIIDAIVSELLASRAFGDRVYVQRAIALSDVGQELPAACVFMGPNEPITEYNSETLDPADGMIGNEGLALFDFRLTVIITVACTGAKEREVLEQLLVLDSAAHRSVMADRMHGLESFVIGTAPRGHPDGANVEASAERIAGSLESRWSVDYLLQAITPE